MNNDTYLIDRTLLEEAEDICVAVKNDNCRNRAVANVFAAKLAANYFENIDIDTNTGLHNAAIVLEDIDISDVYVQNTYIDVRIYFKNNELCVPKSHFDRNILPVAYMFIQIDENLANSTVTGFITPSAVDRTTELDGYYRVNADSLISYYDIEPLLTGTYGDDLTPETELNIHNYLDGNITDTDAFYRDMLGSETARKFLLKAYKAKLIFGYTAAESSVLNSILSQDIETSPTDSEDNSSETDGFTEEISNDMGLELAEFSESENLLDDTVDELAEFSESGNLLDDTVDELAEFSESENLLDDTVDEPDITVISNDNSFEPNESNDFLEDIETLPEIEDYEPLTVDNDDVSPLEEVTEETAQEEIEDYEPLTVDNDDVSPLEEVAEETVQEEIEDYEPLTVDNNDVSPLEEVTEETVQEEIDGLSFNQEDDTDKETFSTEITPSMHSIEANDEEVADSQDSDSENIVPENMANLEGNVEEEEEEEETNDLQEAEDSVKSYEIEDADSSEESIQSDDISSYNTEAPNENTLDELFTQREIEDTNTQPDLQQKKKYPIIPILGCLVLLSLLGHFAYTKFSAVRTLPKDTLTVGKNVTNNTDEKINTEEQEAMPIESLDNSLNNISKNEGTAVSIPAIENNLDASILVSNLSVSWEVPAGYITNNSAKRYFTKIGKIIQLNLKTEMLLLNKPPINNRIVLELEYNKSKQMFDVKGITVDSGEKNIDDLIIDTVRRVLSMNININTSSFGNIQGNPALIIKL